MPVIELTETEINQLVSVFGSFPLQTLMVYLQEHICMVHKSKTQDEFEQRAKILAFLTYKTNNQRTTN